MRTYNCTLSWISLCLWMGCNVTIQRTLGSWILLCSLQANLPRPECQSTKLTFMIHANSYKNSMLCWDVVEMNWNINNLTSGHVQKSFKFVSPLFKLSITHWLDISLNKCKVSLVKRDLCDTQFERKWTWLLFDGFILLDYTKLNVMFILACVEITHCAFSIYPPS